LSHHLCFRFRFASTRTLESDSKHSPVLSRICLSRCGSDSGLHFAGIVMCDDEISINTPMTNAANARPPPMMISTMLAPPPPPPPFPSSSLISPFVSPAGQLLATIENVVRSSAYNISSAYFTSIFSTTHQLCREWSVSFVCIRMQDARYSRCLGGESGWSSGAAGRLGFCWRVRQDYDYSFMCVTFTLMCAVCVAIECAGTACEVRESTCLIRALAPSSSLRHRTMRLLHVGGAIGVEQCGNKRAWH